MRISLKVKGVITLIVLFCTLAVLDSVVSTYKLEKELNLLKLEAKETKVEAPRYPIKIERRAKKKVVRNIRTTETVKESLTVPAAEPEKEKIAPVQFIAHEEIPLASEIQEHIESECERLEVDAAYIYALIESESSFRTGLLVEDGGGHSAGLCQINSVNWPDMEKKGLDPMNELDNITYCISLVKGYVDKYPTIDHVTTCYKAGEGGAKSLDYHLSVCDKINERTEHFKEILKGGKEDGTD